jgi:hypothetical protein
MAQAQTEVTIQHTHAATRAKSLRHTGTQAHCTKGQCSIRANNHAGTRSHRAAYSSDESATRMRSGHCGTEQNEDWEGGVGGEGRPGGTHPWYLSNTCRDSMMRKLTGNQTGPRQLLLPVHSQRPPRTLLALLQVTVQSPPFQRTSINGATALRWVVLQVRSKPLCTPHHTTPHNTTSHRTTPHHTTPHHTAPHHTTPYRTAPHHTTPHHTTPHHTIVAAAPKIRDGQGA